MAELDEDLGAVKIYGTTWVLNYERDLT